MPTTVRWDGLPEFHADVLRRIEAARDAAHDFVASGGHLIERSAKARAREGGRHKRGTRTPARKGGGPAVITGTLGRSIMVGNVVQTGLLAFETKVGPTAVYGRRVELEYDFPYMKPGTEDAIPGLVRLAGVMWRKAVTG